MLAFTSSNYCNFDFLDDLGIILFRWDKSKPATVANLILLKLNEVTLLLYDVNYTNCSFLDGLSYQAQAVVRT